MCVSVCLCCESAAMSVPELESGGQRPTSGVGLDFPPCEMLSLVTLPLCVLG